MAYEPRTPPDSPEDLKQFLIDELANIANAINNQELDIISFKIWHETPPKLREGDEFYGALNVGVTGAAGWRIVNATGILLR